MESQSKELFGAGMWSENAVRAHRGPESVLEERHAHRCVPLKRFPTKGKARAAMEAMIAEGADRDRYRVERVRG